MATDISAAPPVQNQEEHVEQDSAAQPLTNGDVAKDITQDVPELANQESFVDNGALPTTTINIKDAQPDPNPAGPTPVEDVSGGMQPVADFLPKAAPVNSHPTPPPEQPLVTEDADVDTAMADAEVGAPAAPEPVPERITVPEPAPAPEQSLVRPREDDDDDMEVERAAKRSRVEDEPVESAIPESALGDAPKVEEAAAESVVDQSAAAPSSESTQATPVAAEIPAPAEPAAAVDHPAPIDPAPTNGEPAAQPAESAAQAQPAETDAKLSIEAAPASASAPAKPANPFDAPMTKAQKAVLQEKTKNLKKTKHAIMFLAPVDPIALNIPTYPDIIKNPMDLGTMDQKLKNGQYPSVQAFVDDFNLVVKNSRTFNGDAHPVTQAAMSMKAYFDKMMEAVPTADQPLAPPKAQKKGSPAVKADSRRQSRAPPPPAAAATGQSFALQQGGVPQIRREATKDRPARAIKPPASREIEYGKPKRKANQLELRFCEHALDQIRSARYGQINHVFQAPVDPVALNIPHYFQVIKHPMDLATMQQKLKTGQYENAKQVRKDFDLIIENCLLFNPQGNPVRDMGIQLRRQFDEIWKGKDKWERAHKPESARGSTASGDDDSDAEDADEDDEPEDGKEQTIQALQKQLADMQNMIAGLGGGAKPVKPKKSKTKDGKRNKIGSLSSAPPKSKAPAAKSKKAPGKQKTVTYEEKQEISDAVGQMNDDQVQELTKIITENCSKYKNMEEMELEIDELPNNVQILLLKYVRRLFGRAKSAAPASPPDDGEFDDDEEYEGGRAARGGDPKRKKHKPMGKKEQQETIQSLNAKLEQFKQVGTSGSESPTNTSSFQAKAESSGDDESEESEEE